MDTAVKKNTRTKLILKVIHILAWIIFIGVCIKTGAILYSFFVSLFINPVAAQNLHRGLNLSELYRFDISHYSTLVSFIIVLTALRAYIFYVVIKIFLKINFVNPFSAEVSSLISRISYVAFGIGILTLVTNKYTDWLEEKGVKFPDLQEYTGGAAEFLFFAAVIFFIAQVFKKGIEIQSENALTI